MSARAVAALERMTENDVSWNVRRAALLARLQLDEGHRATAGFGFATAALLTIGTGEGLMLAAGQDGSVFAAGTITGFLALTAWLIATGTLLLRRT